MKNLRDSLPSWIDSDRAAAVGSLKVRFKFRIQSYMLIALFPHGNLYEMPKTLTRGLPINQV